jgi:probable rRNA maturation factor
MNYQRSSRHVNVQVARLCDMATLDSESIEQLAKTVCTRFGIAKAVISIAVVDDEHISKLNRQFLKHDATTDVLSFDLSDGSEPHEKCFEIIVNAALAARTAEREHHSPRDELALYIVHGLLHQFGFDDGDDENAEKMHRTEEQILRQRGYDFVYS